MQKLNVSFLSGLITTRDAMSNVCRQHMEAIYAWGLQRGINVEVRIYAAKAEIHDPRIIEVENAATIIADDHFQRSQLVIGEFGCIFGLFDAIHFAPPWAKTVVCYHGLTPPAVMPRHMAEALRASYRQAGTMLGVDQIITQSNFLKGEVVGMGVDPDRIAVVNLPVAVKPPTVAQTRTLNPGRIRLAYLGRIVNSKGVVDLVEAMRLLGANKVELTIMGSRRVSDEMYLSKVESMIDSSNLHDRVKMKLDLSNQDVSSELAAADALVIPSYHEGFCVPVIEALNCGCFVLCSNRGSLPEVSAGLGRSFRAKDPKDLASKITELGESLAQGGFTTDRGFLEFAEWKAQVAQHLRSFDPAHCDAAFLEPVMRGVDLGDADSLRYLADVRKEAISHLHRSQPKPLDSKWAQSRIRQILKEQGVLSGPRSGESSTAPRPPESQAHSNHHPAPRPAPPAPPTTNPSSSINFSERIEALLAEPAEEFIHGIYDLLLHRHAERESMNYWLRSLDAGIPRIKIVEQIALSAEAQSHRSNLDWLLHLDRFRYRTSFSGEVIRILLLPDRQFIEEAYRVLLGREPDEAGAESFIARLGEGMHRMEVVRLIAQSEEGQRHIGDLTWLEKMPNVDGLIKLSKPDEPPPPVAPAVPVDYAARIEELMSEPVEKFIDGVYRLLLGRSPETEVMGVWIANMDAGLRRIQVVEKIAFSEEAKQRHADTSWLQQLDRYRYVPDYANQIIKIIGLPDEEFVVEAYRILLDRSPDKPSADFFTSKIREGAHRMEIVRNLATSEEGKKRLIDLTWLDKMPNVDDMIRMSKLRRKWRQLKRSLMLET